MSEFLAPLNYDCARDVLRRLSLYTAYTPEGAAQVLDVLHMHYPLVFSSLEQKTFENGAVLLEMAGANITTPLVFVSHLDAPRGESVAAYAHDMPMSVPLSRAHVITLLEALEGLLSNGYRPGGDLLLALSMDGLSGGKGALSIAEHLKARSLRPCFVLDYGGYAMEAFRTYLPENAPLALIGIAEKGELQGVVRADEQAKKPVNVLLRAGARLSLHTRSAALCEASERMLKTLGAKAPLLQRLLVTRPRLTFPAMRILWQKRSIHRQFFCTERTLYAVSAPGTPECPADSGEIRLRQTLIPGQKNAAARRRIARLAGRKAKAAFHVDLEAGAPNLPQGEAWDALCTAIEIQFERAVIAPCLSPFVTDGRFYTFLGGTVYRFSPFMITGAEGLSGLCTVTDGTLQTAVQFFRSMLSV